MSDTRGLNSVTRQKLDENGLPSVTNLLQGRFTFTDRLDDDDHGSRRPSRLSAHNAASWPQALVVNDGRATPLIENLIKWRFSNEGNANDLPRPFRHPQALDEKGVPMIESTIKGRWYCMKSEDNKAEASKKAHNWIARNKAKIKTLNTVKVDEIYPAKRTIQSSGGMTFEQKKEHYRLLRNASAQAAKRRSQQSDNL